MEELAFQLLKQSISQVGELKRYHALRASLHLLHLQVRRMSQAACSGFLFFLYNAPLSVQLPIATHLYVISAVINVSDAAMLVASMMHM